MREEGFGAWFAAWCRPERRARVTAESLARALHEAGREAVKRGQVLNVPVGGENAFREWDDLPDRAKNGRRSQAAYLLRVFKMKLRRQGVPY